MCKIDVAIMKIEEAVEDCTEILMVRNPVDNLSRDTSEDSEFEDFPREILTVEVVRSDIKPEVSRQALSESGVPCVTIGKNDSCRYLGKICENRKLLPSNQDKTLEELKALLSREVASLMQEIKLTWQDMEIVNNPAEKNIDLKAAVAIGV